MSIQFNIEIKAKHLYILAALVVIGVGGVYFSTAYGTNDPSNFGHDYGEIEGVQAEISGSCGSGETLKTINDDGSIVCEDLPSTSGVPSGAIMIFDKNCPSGWSRFDQLDGRYPRGASSYGGTGGSDTHNHGTSTAPQEKYEPDDIRVLTGLSSASNIDPYLNVIYCKKN